MLPNLALRSLEFGLRVWYKLNVEDLTEKPAITLARLPKHTRGEDPSELVLKFPSSIRNPGEEKKKQFINVACQYVPRHLGKRLIFLQLNGLDYIPLENLMAARGVEPAPDR
ncbi:MAG TPA: hypothetical protein VGL56_10715 [Fimbriimonadaceae bacterium]|jgi:hypothetical protein